MAKNTGWIKFIVWRKTRHPGENHQYEVVGSVKETNQKDTDTNKRFDFGIPKWVIYTGASVLTFAIVYKLYKAKK